MKKNQAVISGFFEEYQKFYNEFQDDITRCSLIIFSNGVETSRYIDMLALYREMITSIYITLNGSQENHDKTRIFSNGKGSYDLIVNGITHLLENDINTWLVFNSEAGSLHLLESLQNLITGEKWLKYPAYKGCCVSRIKNRNDNGGKTFAESDMINKLIEIANNTDVDLELFNFEDMRILKNFQRFLLFAKGQDKKPYHQFHGCGNRIHQFSFDINGLIYPCSPASGERNLSVGSFFPEFSLETQMEKFWTHRNVFDSVKCSGCSLALICGGGCALSAKLKNGNFNNVDCPDARSIVEAWLKSLDKGMAITSRETVYNKTMSY